MYSGDLKILLHKLSWCLLLKYELESYCQVIWESFSKLFLKGWNFISFLIKIFFLYVFPTKDVLQIDKNVLQWKNLEKSGERKFCKPWTDFISMNIPTFFHRGERMCRNQLLCTLHCTDAKIIKQMIDP